MNKKISIIVPVYNGEESIERCIQSVFSLKYENWELIIINDGSYDNTQNICQKYINDVRVKLINKYNEGVSVARNVGISNATGEYIIFLDSDDYLEENACSVFAENIKYSDWCVTGYIQHYNDGTIIQKSPCNQSNKNNYTLAEFAEAFEDLYLSGFINSPWAKCYKKELITEFFDSEFFLGEDLIFNLNYLKNCKDVNCINIAVYNYMIQSEGSLSSGFKTQSFQILYNVYEESKKLLLTMFGNVHAWENSLNQKFLIDMLVLIERGIRSKKISDYDSMIKIIRQYDIQDYSNVNNTMIYGWKWRMASYLLKKEKYRCMYVFFVAIYKLKKSKEKIVCLIN